MAQFQLSFGAGQVDAFVDLATLTTHVYAPSTTEQIHASYGGRQYYSSCSGLSGAGWIPARPTIRRAATLRVDVAKPRFPRGGEIMPGIRLIIPHEHIARGGGRWNWYLLVRGSEVYVTNDSRMHDLLPRLLRGEEIEGGRPFIIRWMAKGAEDGSYLRERQLTVQVHGELAAIGGRLGRRRLLELVFHDQLEWGLIASQSAWQAELGLSTGTDGEVYRTAGGLLRGEAQIDRDVLQEECPWAFFLEGSLDYVVQRDGVFGLLRYDAYGTPPDWRGSYGGWEPISPAEALAIYRTGELPARPEMVESGAGTEPEPLDEWKAELLAAHKVAEGER